MQTKLTVNRTFPWWRYAQRLLVHNLTVPYDYLFSTFYMLFDWIGLRLHLWRKKGDERSYVAEKFRRAYGAYAARDLKDEPFSYVNVYTAARVYLARLGYKGDDLNVVAYRFHDQSYARFSINYHRLRDEWLTLQIKDASDLIDVCEALELTTQRQAEGVFGKDGYEHIKTLSVKALGEYLQPKSEQ